METATEPGVEDVPEVEDVPNDDLELDASESDEVETDPDGERDEAEPETVELEIKGKTYKLPAELKDEFMLRPDYTRKTQEVAEMRRVLQDRIAAAEAVSDEEINVRARTVALDAALEQYKNIDWDALDRESPAEANRLWRQYERLKEDRGEAEKKLTGLQGSREAETQRERAEQFRGSMAVLEKEIPDWGEAKAQDLKRFAETFGFDEAEFIEALHDPRQVKLVHAAFAALTAKPPKPKPEQPAVKPAAKVKGGSVPRKGLDDRTSINDWMKQRQAQAR